MMHSLGTLFSVVKKGHSPFSQYRLDTVFQITKDQPFHFNKQYLSLTIIHNFGQVLYHTLFQFLHTTTLWFSNIQSLSLSHPPQINKEIKQNLLLRSCWVKRSTRWIHKWLLILLKFCLQIDSMFNKPAATFTQRPVPWDGSSCVFCPR